MKHKWILLVTMILAFMLGITLVQAQDATPEPGTPQENECNPGGVLYRAENQDGCPNEWYWKAGWYLAAVNTGRISRDEMPDEFKIVLPPAEEVQTDEPQPISELPIGSCWPHVYGGFAYQYVGPANTLKNALGYGVRDCVSTPATILDRVATIFAHSLSEAAAICSSLGELDSIRTFPDLGIPMPPHVYYCAVKP